MITVFNGSYQISFLKQQKNNLKLFLNLCLTKIILYGNILVDKKKQNKKGVKDYEIRRIEERD